MDPPCKSYRFKEKSEEREHTIEVYTDGSTSPSGVGAGIAVFKDKHPMFQLRYKLAECSSNQAEQLAMANQ